MAKTDKSLIWFAVVNVFAASKNSEGRWTKAEALLKEYGVEYHSTRTGKAGNAREHTFDACMAGYRRFIAVGGDGTVHDVLNGIAEYVEFNQTAGNNISVSDFTLSVIPVGSGNDWIKSLGIPCRIRDAVAAIARGHVDKQDLIRADILDPMALPEEVALSSSYMVNIGGVGIDGKVCKHVNEMKEQGRAGKWLYIVSLLYVLKERRSSRIKVFCDDNLVFDGPYYSLAFGNGKFSGGGMRQTPDAVLDDGLLDVTVIPEVKPSVILRQMHKLYTKRFLKIPQITHARGKEVLVVPVDKYREQLLEIDGEVVGNAPVKFVVLDTQLNVIKK